MPVKTLTRKTWVIVDSEVKRVLLHEPLSCFHINELSPAYNVVGFVDLELAVVKTLRNSDTERLKGDVLKKLKKLVSAYTCEKLTLA